MNKTNNNKAPRTLVIGDVHGKANRLRALLRQEGIIDHDDNRINHDVRVIQLGDLGHFGHDAPPEDDYDCWSHAEEWFDVVLMGNHDMAVLDSRHYFDGFRPVDEGDKNARKYKEKTVAIIHELRAKGFARFAVKSHGYLLTHAGLHPLFDGSHRMAKQGFNTMDDFIEYVNHNPNDIIVNSVSHYRGGPTRAGGILWRDFNESLSKRWPQVYGHSAGKKVRRIDESYCIDVGGVENGRLAGLWLPDCDIVEVNLDEISYNYLPPNLRLPPYTENKDI